ncbi:TatD family hydrolase [Brucepastera parasyntrophica]|uniref:TatD family hydrolase n=1 Tax=Brucepastera parasyntrophica TaxID=2880008 RepID=UPI00210A32CD|nr:TatD family hydrolase [Brucepastera parasyntrophica]ULQ59700.1 TatD family hydrolase [Brucepastera parasyntrophica]
MYIDSHIHLYDLFCRTGKKPELVQDSMACTSAYRWDEFLYHESLAGENPGRIFLSFGIHPQIFAAFPEHDAVKEKAMVMEMQQLMETLAGEGRIHAIGECGFDLFNESFRVTVEQQREVWNFQLDLALERGLPLVIHCRKALHLLFAEIRKLSKVRAVIFHGWPGSLVEAESFLQKGVNAFFCAGKNILKGDKSLCKTVAGINPARLLTETDAPYMQLKGEPYSIPDDIYPVTRTAAALSGIAESAFEEQVEKNFRRIFLNG